MKENWLALCLCMLREIPIDTALAKMDVITSKHHAQSNPRQSKYSYDDIYNILRLKEEGNSYREIGELIGMTKDQVWGAIRTYRRKATRTPTKVVQVAI